MKVTVTEPSPVERTLEIDVDPERMDAAYDRALRKAAKHLVVRGFRKGRVPPTIAARHIPRDTLDGEILEDVLPAAYAEALERESLTPVSKPKWEIVERDSQKKLVFKVTFEVKPHLEIAGYKGIEVTQELPPVADEDVERHLEELRERHAQIAAVEEERGLREGDYALVDFTTTSEGQPLENGSAQNYLMELKPELYVPGFLDNVYGLRPGEEREFEITFPDDFPGRLAGKEVHWHLELHEIKRRVVPELTDDFAAEVSDCETLEELRSRVREGMEQHARQWADEHVARKLLEQLVEQVPDDRVPSGLRDLRARLFAAHAIEDLHRRGLTLEKFIEQQGKTQQDWMQYALLMGHQDVRMEILIESLARIEGIEVDEEEVEGHVRRHAEQLGEPLSQVRRKLEEEGSIEALKSNLLRSKVVSFLVENASVDYVAPREEEVEAAYEEETAEAEGEDTAKDD